MKPTIKGQVFELLCEPLLVCLVAIVALFFGDRGGTFVDAIVFSASIWVTALIYRFIFFQIPLAVVIKYFFSLRKLTSPWLLSFVNILTLIMVFGVFEIVFGGVENFFSADSILIPISILFSSSVSPFFVNLIYKIVPLTK